MSLSQSITRIALDVRETESQLSVSVKQGDTLRRIIATFTDHCKPYYIDESCYAILTARKADGTYVCDSCVIQNNQIIYDFSLQLTVEPGAAQCEFALYGNSGEVMASPRFTVYVYESVLAEGASNVVSDDSFAVLNDLIAEANEAINRAEEISTDVEGITPHIGADGNWYIGETDTGVKAAGIDGANGDPFTYEDFTPEQLADLKGTDGKDGISATHEWNGTTLTITSASGTSSADLQGPPGETTPRTATLVIGTSTQGHTLADCDYLCTGTNDEAVFAEAINALPGNGGEIKVLGGTYNFTYGEVDGENVCLLVNKQSVKITGCGDSTKIYITHGSNGYGIKFTNSFCVLSDMYICGADQFDSATVSYPEGSLIYSGSTYNVIRNLYVVQVGYSKGINIASDYCKVINNTVQQCDGNIAAITLSGDRIVVTGNVCMHLMASGTIANNGTTNNVITGNVATT